MPLQSLSQRLCKENVSQLSPRVNLVREYLSRPFSEELSELRVSKLILAPLQPIEETLTILGDCDCLILSSRRLVRRKGPRWLTPRVDSNPFSVVVRDLLINPALLTRMLIWGSSWQIFSANARMDVREARSNWTNTTFWFPLLLLTSTAALSPLSTLLQATWLLSWLSPRLSQDQCQNFHL